MSQEDVALVIDVFTVDLDPRVEMGKLMRDDEHWSLLEDRFSADAEIRFLTPEEGGVEVMEQQFQGLDGLRRGWAVWMEPWKEFRVTVDDIVDSGSGQVLVLASAIAVMRGTGAELPQEVASLSSIQDGRIVGVGFYLDQQQARRDAGLS